METLVQRQERWAQIAEQKKLERIDRERRLRSQRDSPSPHTLPMQPTQPPTHKHHEPSYSLTDTTEGDSDDDDGKQRYLQIAEMKRMEKAQRQQRLAQMQKTQSWDATPRRRSNQMMNQRDIRPNQMSKPRRIHQKLKSCPMMPLAVPQRISLFFNAPKVPPKHYQPTLPMTAVSFESAIPRKYSLNRTKSAPITSSDDIETESIHSTESNDNDNDNVTTTTLSSIPKDIPSGYWSTVQLQREEFQNALAPAQPLEAPKVDEITKMKMEFVEDDESDDINADDVKVDGNDIDLHEVIDTFTEDMVYEDSSCSEIPELPTEYGSPPSTPSENIHFVIHDHCNKVVALPNTANPPKHQTTVRPVSSPSPMSRRRAITAISATTSTSNKSCTSPKSKGSHHQQRHSADDLNSEDIDPEDILKDIQIDRYGFPIQKKSGRNETKMAEDDAMRRLTVRKENELLFEWQHFLFSADQRNGGRLQWSKLNKKSDSDRKTMCDLMRRGGVPQPLRAYVWSRLCNVEAVKSRPENQGLYARMLAHNAEDRPFDEIIWKDIHRTFRENIKFGAVGLGKVDANGALDKFHKNTIHRNVRRLDYSTATESQKALYNVLSAFATHNPQIGYCQGMQAICALLLMYMVEEDAFFALDAIAKCEKWGKLARCWSMEDIHLRFKQFEFCFGEYLPKLTRHLRDHGIGEVSMFGVTTWFVTGFVSAHGIGFDIIVRIWDIYLMKGIKAIFMFGIGFLKYLEKDLLRIDTFEDLLTALTQGFHTIHERRDMDKYIQMSMAVKIKGKQIKKWAQKYKKTLNH